MSKSRNESRAGPKRYPNAVGEGFSENPRCIIRWNGHEFGFQPVDGCFVQLQIQIEGGLYPLIDAMLVKLGITEGTRTRHAAGGPLGGRSIEERLIGRCHREARFLRFVSTAGRGE